MEPKPPTLVVTVSNSEYVVYEIAVSVDDDNDFAVVTSARSKISWEPGDPATFQCTETTYKVFDLDATVGLLSLLVNYGVIGPECCTDVAFRLANGSSFSIKRFQEPPSRALMREILSDALDFMDEGVVVSSKVTTSTGLF